MRAWALAIVLFADVTAADARRLEAQHYVERADKAKGREAVDLYTSGALAYLSLYHDTCSAHAVGCDEIIFNASRAFLAAHDVPKAINAAKILVEKEPRSPLAANATYQLGGIYQSIGVYDEAADWLERYATTHPNADNAPKALSDAVILRLGLSQDDRAEKDALSYLKAYGARQPAQTAAITYALAAHDVERNAWEKARSRLAASMKTIDRGSPDVTIAAHALFGRVLVHAGDLAGARVEHAKARDAWKDPVAAQRTIESSWPAEDEWMHFRRLAKALNAVGEAYLFAADEIRKSDVGPLRLPATKIDDKRAAIERVEKEYLKILELKPEPPPRWVIIAGAHVTAMWTAFADEVTKAKAARDVSDAIVRNARANALRCIDYSVKYQFTDPAVDGCRDWLAKRFEKEHWRVEEIVPGLRAAAPITFPPFTDGPPPP